MVPPIVGSTGCEGGVLGAAERVLLLGLIRGVLNRSLSICVLTALWEAGYENNNNNNLIVTAHAENSDRDGELSNLNAFCLLLLHLCVPRLRTNWVEKWLKLSSVLANLRQSGTKYLYFQRRRSTGKTASLGKRCFNCRINLLFMQMKVI